MQTVFRRQKMGRIKIEDLPKELEISRKEMRKITGAGILNYNYRLASPPDDQKLLNTSLDKIKSKMGLPPDDI
jgi:hypothetical protein